MQPTLQPAETHDAIVALLRDHPPRPARDPSELNIAPGRDEAVAAAPQVEPAPEPVIEAAPAVAPAPVHQEPAFELIPPAPVAEPIMLAPPLEPALRASPSSDIKMDAELHRPPARAGRGLLRFVTMVFVGIGATIAWQVYGETAKERIIELAPQLLAADEQTNATESQPAAQPQPAQAAAAEATPAQPTAPAAPAQAAAAAPPAPAAPPAAAARPADTAQMQAALPADAAQKMEAMSREIASLKQTVEQLKASQLQMNHDLARTMEQQVKRKPSTPAKQTSTPMSQRSADSPPPPTAPVQRASASPPPVATAPRTPPPQNYGQLQTYGQSRVYDPPQTYGRSTSEPYVRPYGRTYDSADADRDDYYTPPPSPNYSPGYSTVPRPPIPLQ